MRIIIGILSLLVLFGLCYVTSKDRGQIRYRPIFVMIALQLVLAFALLYTGIGSFFDSRLRICI